MNIHMYLCSTYGGVCVYVCVEMCVHIYGLFIENKRECVCFPGLDRPDRGNLAFMQVIEPFVQKEASIFLVLFGSTLPKGSVRNRLTHGLPGIAGKVGAPSWQQMHTAHSTLLSGAQEARLPRPAVFIVAEVQLICLALVRAWLTFQPGKQSRVICHDLSPLSLSI